MRRALQGIEHGIKIEYRLPDGRVHLGDVVNGTIHILDLLYADDLVLICESEEALKEVVMRFEHEAQR